MSKINGTSPGLNGDNWLPICLKCHEEVNECCIDVELTLFPDEVENFLERDPVNYKNYHDGTFGYDKKGKCCFLLKDNKCELYVKGKTKPLDCLIFPINYKNGKVFIDNSCFAKHLINKKDAIRLLQEKLDTYPQYKETRYEVRESDEYVMELPIISSAEDK